MPAIRQKHDRGSGHVDERDETVGCTVGDRPAFIFGSSS